MGAARSNAKKDTEQVSVDKPAEGESIKDATDSGLSPDPAVTEAVAEGLSDLGIDPADVALDDINTNVGHPTVDLGETAKSSVRVEDLASYPSVEEHVLDNYRQLKAERGWSWDDVAAHVAHADPRLAAFFRAKGSDLDKAPIRATSGSFESR